MPQANNDLFFLMTTMFIDHINKSFDLQEMTEESKMEYLSKVIHYCEHIHDQNYEPKKPAAQDGWLLLRKDGEDHDVAYEGIWCIEKLKELVSLQFDVKPEDLHIKIIHDSFSSVM